MNKACNDTRVYNRSVRYEDHLTSDESLDGEGLDVVDEDADAEQSESRFRSSARRYKGSWKLEQR